MRTTLAATLVLLAPLTAHAALDDVLSTAGGAVSEKIVAGQTLRVRERRTVREVAGADGKVFAIVWKGTMAPALLDLLGPYRAEYEEGMRTRRRGGHGHLALHTANLSVNVLSHARRFEGSVVLFAHMPKGVTVDALR